MAETIDRRKAIAGLALSALVATISKEGASQQDPQAAPASAPEKIDLTALKRIMSDLLRQAAPMVPRKPFTSPNGEKILARDDPAWEAILKHMKESYPLPGKLSDGLPESLKPIDYGFSFQRASYDSNFRPFHVEPLLNQAADLLDRSIRDRDDWNLNAVRAFDVYIELYEYAAIDKIHQDETTAGFYTLASKESSADLTAETDTAAFGKSSADYLNTVLTQYYTDQAMNDQSGYAQLTAWLSKFAVYKADHHPPVLQATWNGVTKDIPDHLHDAATGMSYHALFTQFLTFWSELLGRRAISTSADDRVQGRRARADWDINDIDFRRRRTQVARDLADLKTKAFTDNGGVLNYPERMSLLKVRFQRDFRDAVARLFAARNGLVKIYGYDSPLPDVLGMDAALLWVRDAIAWMTAFSELDHNCVIPISLKNTIGEEAWKKGLRSGSWELPIDESSLFPDERHVRLRGLSSFVVGPDADDGVWQMKISAPSKSFCRHLSGEVVQLDQTPVMACRLGRILSREHPRSPDVVGASVLYNLSPFGTWNVHINPKSSAGKKIDDLKDIVLDLHVAVREL